MGVFRSNQVRGFVRNLEASDSQGSTMEMALVPVGNQSMGSSDSSGNSKVIQVTNIAPQATRDQMHTLFSFLGKIEDLRLYPSVRDASVSIQARVCFLKFMEEAVLPISLHMTNTVFIDRAIIVQPFSSNEIPDELAGLELANQAARTITGENKLPPHVSNETTDGMIYTRDMPLYQTGLPPFPPLPGSTDPKLVEEIRRTLVVLGVSKETTAQEVMQYFGNGAGEVKYFRWCTRDGVEAEKDEETNGRTCMLEFTDYGVIIPAMRLNNTDINGNEIKVYYSTQSITKPKAKSNEDSLREIEEAMKKVKEAQSLVSATVDPLMGLLNKRSRSKSRERSTHDRDFYVSSMGKESRRSRSRDRYSSRRRSRSRDSRRSKRSRSRDSRRKRSRSKSKEKKVKEEKKDDSEKEVKKEDESGDGKETDKEKSRSRSRSKSKESKRRSRSRKRSRSRSKKRSKRFRSRKRSRSRDRKKRSRSRSHKKKSKKERRPDTSRRRRRRTPWTWRFPIHRRGSSICYPSP